MVELTWVNHSSFVVQQGQAGLICDPWLDGSVFNNAWDLLSPTQWTYDDFRRLTHIWFSHEHPDHFFPSNIQKIPEDARDSMEVLYQATRDYKVLDFCRKLGFRTREARPFEWMDLGNAMRVKCGPFLPYDSWLLIDAPGCKILNLNDCEVKTAAAARAVLKHTGPIDILLSQFSYACWVGNPEDRARREGAARGMLERILVQIEVLRPRYFIPSASFILFSHEENRYMNDAVNQIHVVVKFLQERTDVEIIPMYPGDRWVVGAQHNGAEALNKYAQDYRRGVPVRHKSASVPWGDLQSLAEAHMTRLRSRNTWYWVRLASMPPIRFFDIVTIFLTDHQQAVRFDIFRGLRPAPEMQVADADITMSSDSLAYVLKHDWGMDTLYVNGCFRASQEGFRKFRRSLSLALLNNMGKTFGPSLLRDPVFCSKAVCHFFPRIRAMVKRKRHPVPRFSAT